MLFVPSPAILLAPEGRITPPAIQIHVRFEFLNAGEEISYWVLVFGFLLDVKEFIGV